MRHNPNSKFHGANMGPIWGRQDPGGPHVGPMNFAIWEVTAWVDKQRAWAEIRNYTQYINAWAITIYAQL